MSDNPAVPNGADATAAPEAQDTQDTQDTQAAFEGLLDWEESGGARDENTTESVADEAADAGAQEAAPTGEDEGQPEPQEGADDAPAAIDPPASWSDADKATFAQLPPAAQAVIARRESERDKVVQQRTQEIAEERKATAAERQAIDGQRTQFLESLQVLMDAVVPEARQFAEITDAQWQQLSVDNPAQYVQLRAARDALAEKFGRIQAAKQRVEQEKAQAQEKQLRELLAQEREKLVERIPEFGDAAKAAVLTKDLNAVLTDYYQFTPEEIASAVDHRQISLARDAMLWRKHVAARETVEAKRSNPPPRMQQPNAAPQQDAGPARALREKQQKLARTGSTRDAAELFAEIL
jgi:hypothetical protein